MSDLLTTFRGMHEGAELLCLANVWDAGSARLAESLGARAVATTSGGVAWSLGYADDRNMPADAAIAAAGNIARVLTVPLTVDVEDGWSPDPEIVADHIMALVQAGVVGINIEDGPDDPAVLAAKLEAIKSAAALAGSDVFVNVRTDVYLRGLVPENERVPEVLSRAELYRKSGADGLFVPGIWLPQEIREVVASGAGLPLNVMDWPGLPPVTELQALGVQRFSAGTGIAQAVWGLTRDLVRSFLAGTAAEPGPHKPMDYGDVQQLFLGR